MGRGTDHGNPAGGSKHRLDPVGVEDRNEPATLVELDQSARPLAVRDALVGGPSLARPRVGVLLVAVCQLAPSLTYGRPMAAGGMLRPTTPARTISVRR